ncbi:MAG: hypothetical protein J6T74_03305 [Clostridia bacterium]|nr:hypothetical protein [Clostridia bacterium]
MIIDNNSIKINGTAVGSMLTECIFNFPKLWGDDTGRSLSGTFNGTLRGIFPKLEMTFKPMKQAELQSLVKLLDTDYQQLTYYDPYKEAVVTMQTYTGDYSYTVNNTDHTSTLKISFIATHKRS